jgi:LacI family transcriptional regulator
VGRRGSSKVTLSDVATLAGVSVTTASFVLSGRRDMRISEGTQERVHQAARELSYVPRNSGSSLPVRAPSIGFISDTVGTEPFAGELIRGCVTAATERGHSLLMTETEGLRTLEVSESRELVDRGVGQFLFASMAMRVTTLPPSLRGKPAVMLNCIDRRRSVPSVAPDDLTAGRRAAAELMAAGHGDRILLVGEVPNSVYPGRQRLDGVQQQLAESGQALLAHLSCRWWPQDARTAMLRRLGHPTAERPTAVIALNDRVAMGVYQAAQQVGLTIPQDLSVVSFDDSDVARWLNPGLSSLAIPHYEMGRRAVDMLLDGPTDNRIELLPMPFRSRDSVTRPWAARGRRRA